MDDREGGQRHDTSVDYKTISVALGVVLMGVLSGSVGFWVSRDQHSAEAVRATDDRQWEHIQQLEKAQFEHGSRLHHLEQGQEHIYRNIDDREMRMRKMQEDIAGLKSHVRPDRGGPTHE